MAGRSAADREDKTFFWAYGELPDKTSRSAVLFLRRSELSEFSQSGVTIFNPLTTRPIEQPGPVHPRCVQKRDSPG